MLRLTFLELELSPHTLFLNASLGNGSEPFLQQAIILKIGIDDNFYSDTGFPLVSLGDTATTVLL